MPITVRIERLLLGPPRKSTQDERMTWTLDDMKRLVPEWSGNEETGWVKQMLPLDSSKY